MKRPPLLCLLGSALIAGCTSAGSPMPSTPAVLTENAAQCRAQLRDAAHKLLGRVVTLTPDAFVHNDAVVLTTTGQSASGRMLPPTEILRLQRNSQGCRLQLEGRSDTVALPHCACRALDVK